MTRKKRTKEGFIQDAKNIHGDKYDYSLVEYKGVDYKVDIVCSVHNEKPFPITPYKHLLGQGCPSCAN